MHVLLCRLTVLGASSEANTELTRGFLRCVSGYLFLVRPLQLLVVEPLLVKVSVEFGDLGFSFFLSSEVSGVLPSRLLCERDVFVQLNA